MRYGRVIVNLAIAGACLGLVALEIMGPATSGPGARPIDTFSHLDVKVDDAGAHLATATVPAGQVEVTVVDARSHRDAPLSLRSQPAGFDLHEGTQLATVRTLHTYSLQASAGAHAIAGSAALAVVFPTLAASREFDKRVTLSVDNDGMSSPRRDARFEEPIDARVVDPATDNTPWTTTKSGVLTIAMQNHEGALLSCAVDGRSAGTIAPGKTRSTSVTLQSGVHTVVCGSTRFDLWAT